LDKFGEKKAQNLLNAVEKSKECDLASFIYALGIPNVGKKTSKDIVKKFKSLDKIINTTVEELLQVPDVGEIVANSVIKFFGQDKIINSIEELLKLGVKPSFEEIEVSQNPFEGKTVVVTGSLKNYSRTEIKNKLESLGAKVSSSVSKKTSYVLVGEDPGSKRDKAIQLGVNIITEEAFEEILKEQ